MGEHTINKILFIFNYSQFSPFVNPLEIKLFRKSGRGGTHTHPTMNKKLFMRYIITKNAGSVNPEMEKKIEKILWSEPDPGGEKSPAAKITGLRCTTGRSAGGK